MSHGHSHSHGGGHSHDEAYPDDDWNLHQHVERAEALNAVAIAGGDEGAAMRSAPLYSSGKAMGVLKPHARRPDQSSALFSDADEQLIVKIIRTQFGATWTERPRTSTSRRWRAWCPRK